MVGSGRSNSRPSLKLWIPVLIVQVSFCGVSALHVPSQGIATTRVSTSSLQASSAEENMENVYNGYNLDTSSLQDSLKAMRESISSIQESIDATKRTLASVPISSDSMTISDATPSFSSSRHVAEVTSNPVEMVQLDDAPQIWNDVMAQIQNSPYFSTPSDDQYFPSSSVDSMRDSLNLIQQSILERHAIHGTESSMLLANLPADHAATAATLVVDAASTTTMAGAEKVPTLVDYITGKMGISGDFQSKLSLSSSQAWKDATNFVENASSQTWKGATKFMEDASSESVVIMSNAKIKLSMMVSNTYLVLGLKPPEEYVQSGATITPSISLITAFFALLWAMGSKQLARSQAEDSMKAIILEYQRQQATLKSQMVPMTVEISRLNDQIIELQEEIYVTNAQIERLEFKRSLEREFWAAKLKAKRRRIHRMRQDLATKKAQMETGTAQHEERLETVRQQNKALEALSKNGKMVFDQSLKIVSFLGDMIGKQHQLHQARVEEQRLQGALKEVEQMNMDLAHQQQMHQTSMNLQEALREVEEMELKVNGATNSTTTSPSSLDSTVPLYFATSQMIQP